MRNRTGIAVGLAFALVLATVLIPTAGADGRRPRRLQSDLLRMETFNVSGEFTGALSGEILLGGTRYRIGTNVQVYEIGRGLIPAGSVVGARHVFLAGVKTLGSNTVFSIIVRPATVPSLDQDYPSRYTSIQATSPEDE